MVGGGAAVGDAVESALQLAHALAPRAAAVHRGGCTAYLSTLAGLGAADLTTARVVEPHLDAIAILAQAEGPARRLTDPDATWGVFAASAPGRRLTARRETELDGVDGVDGVDGIKEGPQPGWLLSGTKPWCSLAGRLSHALVTAQDPDGHGRLFAVALRHDGVVDLDTPWVARGLGDVRTTTLTMTDVPAEPVGPPGWYLSRPGFAWGAIGVAAVWYGAAVALRDTLLEASRRRPPDQIALAALGRADTAVYAAGCVLAEAGRLVDERPSAAGDVADATNGSNAPASRDSGGAGAVTDAQPDWGMLAARVRAVVHDAAETCLRTVGHALGPGPLTGDDVHARRVAELTVYLRQHHADRDLARLGESILAQAQTSAPAGAS